MDGLIIIISVALFSCFASMTVGESQLGRGFNDNIDWVSLEDGQKLAKEQNKPAMVLIHKSWCGACKALKPKFAESKEIEQLSKSFVMINILDDEEPDDSDFKPDGGYIPRILFIEASGKVMTDIINENGSDKYKYFYPSPEQIIQSMRKCLEELEAQKQNTVSTDEL